VYCENRQICISPLKVLGICSLCEVVNVALAIKQWFEVLNVVDPSPESPEL